MVCGLPTHRYFQGIWCSNGVRAANPQVLSRHLVLEMVCGLPTRRYFQGIWCLKWCAGCQPAGTFNRYFQGIWCLKCCASCQPAGTFKAFGAWNALRAANAQVLSRHLLLEMLCGLPTRRYLLEMVFGLPTRRYFQGIWCLKCPAGCQPAMYFQGIWCLECPAGCQPAGTFKAFGAWNALRAANPQVLSTGTFKAFGAWNALRAASPQVLSRHLVLEMLCGLPSRRYFQGIWCLKWCAGCQPAGTFKAFGA